MIHYKPIEKLHSSEQGSVVLKVKNTDTEEICVLKLIGQLSDKLNRLIFRREVAALKKLNQFDDIVRIYDSSDKLQYNKKAGYGAILLELIDGQAVSTIDFSGFTDLEKIIVCKNVATAVLHAHQCGILHRDIKPANIMLLENATEIKMIDFGSSKLKAIVDDETSLRLFTPGYVAPEVSQGQEATEKSDIYSLGAVFYYIFFGCPPSHSHLQDDILASGVVHDMQSLLLKMLASDPEARKGDVQEIVNEIGDIIGKLNTSAYHYWFYVDSSKLDALKRQYIVERAMTYQQFLTSYLPTDFIEMYGIFKQGDTTDVYEFVGDNLYMECTYNSEKRQFNATKLYEIPIDKRSKLQRIFGLIEGKKSFFGPFSAIQGKNHNNKLKTQLCNYADERASLDSKNKRFEEVFGKWRESIQESFDSVKEKCIKIEYAEYWFENSKLNFSLADTISIDIDSLTQETHFVFDAPENPREKTIAIGCFDDYYCDNEGAVLVLALDGGATQGKLTPYLEEKRVVLEDYKKQTVALRRQLAAITSLKNEDYNAAGLKDILLELSAPTSTYAIQSLKFHNAKLNGSQQNAIKKAIYSNNISLIQGPPGTGKTSVITELIQQIIKQGATSETNPKILVVSQSHTAVDNILEKLFNWDTAEKLKIVRIGKEKDVSKSVASHYLLDAIRESMFSDIQTLSSAYMSEKIQTFSPAENDDQKASESKQASLITWEKAQGVHTDWLKRCGDYTSLRYQIINTATIIAGTCIGFLSDENVRDMIFDYVIVDEAAKATTPELLVSIIKAEKIVLVGDQNQLPPFADAAVSKLGATLVKDSQYRIFDILYESLPDTHKQFLATQYRMCSTIGNLISTVFYDGKIITDDSNDDRMYKV